MIYSRIKLLALSLSSLLLFACTETETPQSPILESKTITLNTKVSDYPHESTLPGENQIDILEAYLFNNGKLESMLGELTKSAESDYSYTLRLPEIPLSTGTSTAKLYCVANCDHTFDASLEEKITTEEEFLQAVCSRNLGSQPQHILSGKIENFSSATTTENVILKRGVARIDLKVLSPTIAVNKISIKHVAQSGFIFEQKEVQTAQDCQYLDISKTYNTPNTTGDSGIFYLYEQNNDSLEVSLEVSSTKNNKIVSAKTKLPKLMKRNNIYTIKVEDCSEDGDSSTNPEPKPEITIDVSSVIADWENGGEVSTEVQI